VRKDLNEWKSSHDMSVRLGVLEEVLKMKKRGVFDYRILFFVILMVLLYLFLKTVELVP
tara:strand:+ start:444 stop:620 length:177 start_codon:yes stop_codon:yes gene_type:complete